MFCAPVLLIIFSCFVSSILLDHATSITCYCCQSSSPTPLRSIALFFCCSEGQGQKQSSSAVAAACHLLLLLLHHVLLIYCREGQGQKWQRLTCYWCQLPFTITLSKKFKKRNRVLTRCAWHGDPVMLSIRCIHLELAWAAHAFMPSKPAAN